MKRYISGNKGFTLVEVLVVMVIVLVVGSTIIGVLFAAARNSNKASSLDVVKRNGNYAIEQMAKTIRYAAKFDGVGIADENGEDINTIYETNCVLPIITPAPTPTIYRFVKVTKSDGDQVKYSCLDKTFESPTAGRPHVQEVSEENLNTNVKTNLVDRSVVDIVSCSITCQQETIVSPPTLTISMTLQKKLTSGLTENQSAIPFQTSVTFRNY